MNTPVRLATFSVVVASGSLAAQAPSWRPSPGHAQLALWPGVAPDARPGPDSESVATSHNPVAGRPWTYISNVSRPTLTVYPP